MTATDKHMEAAADLVERIADVFEKRKYDAAIPAAEIIAAALHAQDQEARKSERERASALIEACTETFARCEIENDWTGLLSTLSAAILETGEFERTD